MAMTHCLSSGSFETTPGQARLVPGNTRHEASEAEGRRVKHLGVACLWSGGPGQHHGTEGQGRRLMRFSLRPVSTGPPGLKAQCLSGGPGCHAAEVTGRRVKGWAGQVHLLSRGPGHQDTEDQGRRVKGLARAQTFSRGGATMHGPLWASCCCPNVPELVRRAGAAERTRHGMTRAAVDSDWPLTVAVSLCLLEPLLSRLLPLPSLSTLLTTNAKAQSEDGQGEDVGPGLGLGGVKYGTMTTISFVPFFNWLTWVFAFLDSGKAKYLLFAFVYFIPTLKYGFDISPEDHILPLLFYSACLIHVQVDCLTISSQTPLPASNSGVSQGHEESRPRGAGEEPTGGGHMAQGTLASWEQGGGSERGGGEVLTGGGDGEQGTLGFWEQGSGSRDGGEGGSREGVHVLREAAGTECDKEQLRRWDEAFEARQRIRAAQDKV